MNERFSTMVCDDASSKPNFLAMEVACRKCDNCLRRRAAMWRYRAVAEWRAASRTWMATLTLSPASVARLLARCQVTASRGGTTFEALPDEEQFLALANEGYRHVQLWLKRLRKNTGVPVRYLAITEAHKSGLPHFHVLLHEMDKEKPLRYKTLSGSWMLGRIQNYKLVTDSAGASYVTKYLFKSASARVRSSGRYGQNEVLIPAALSGSDFLKGEGT